MPGILKQQVKAVSNAYWQRFGHDLLLPCKRCGPGCPDSAPVYFTWYTSITS